MGKEVKEYGLVLAIDSPSREETMGLISKVGPYVDGIKLGAPTLLANGVSLLSGVRNIFSGPLIADLKVADIGFRGEGAGRVWSGTNRAIIETAVGAGVDYVTCQTIIGTSSIQECVETAHSIGGKAMTLPYMTHEGAGLFFDLPLDFGHVGAQLAALGMGGVKERLEKLRLRKGEDKDWRSPVPTVSDLILLIGEELGLDGYIAPANRVDVMKDYRKLTDKKVMATGIGRQGGTLEDVYLTLGRNSAGIAGHTVYASGDPVAAIKQLHSQREAIMRPS